ncbi:MAG: M20/M25/M40 family metallo-hydrolase, partial [Candidatus Dormibacteraceae bacterium]
MATPEWIERVRALTRELVGIPSVNGTPEEARFPDRLRELLLRSPSFRDHPGRIRVLPIPGDPNRRRNLVAWVPGGPRTVLLTGHFDVVTTANLGALERLAFDPERLLDAATDLLRREAQSGQPDPLAERDLASGDWMLGRGALDMKSGLACGIAVLERAAAESMGGSLLLVATPDEEATSA